MLRSHQNELIKEFSEKVTGSNPVLTTHISHNQKGAGSICEGTLYKKVVKKVV